MRTRVTTCLTSLLVLLAAAEPSATEAVRPDAGGDARGPNRTGHTTEVRVEFVGAPIRSIIVFDSRQAPARAWLQDTSAAQRNDLPLSAVVADAAPSPEAELPDQSGAGDGNNSATGHPPFKRTSTSTILLPEPATAAFLILGAGGLLLLRRHRPKT